MDRQRAISASCGRRLVGKKINVLIEEKRGDVFVGRTQYDAYDVDGQVFVPGPGPKVGSFYKTRIIDNYEYDLIGG